jgi:hypothetical protein
MSVLTFEVQNQSLHGKHGKPYDALNSIYLCSEKTAKLHLKYIASKYSVL